MPKRGQGEAAAERRYKSLTLRMGGKSYRAIGKIIGISEAQAHRDVQDALHENIERHDGDIRKLRELESERLDRLWANLWPRMFVEHDGARLLNYDTIDRLLKISERRSKLLGIDKPGKIDVAVSDWRKQLEILGVNADEAEAALEGLAERIAERSTRANAFGSGSNS